MENEGTSTKSRVEPIHREAGPRGSNRRVNLAVAPTGQLVRPRASTRPVLTRSRGQLVKFRRVETADIDEARCFHRPVEDRPSSDDG